MERTGEPSSNKTKYNSRGVSVNALVMPVVIILAILHVFMIYLIFSINKSSGLLSAVMQKAGIYTQDATSLLAGSSLLSETSSNFILMPLTENGEVNVSPLAAYAQELELDRRGSQVLARFQNYDVTPEVYDLLSIAAESADAMLNAQLHAISLMASIYPLPQINPLNHIPLIPLTEDELNMTNDQKEAVARTLILGSVYAVNKQSVSQNVNAAVGVIQGMSSAKAAEASARVTGQRSLLWVGTITIIVILIITFSMLYRKLILPLNRFSEQIPNDSFLDEDIGFREVNLLASAYNGVLKRRNSLDNILRSAAETDALTNLPNRYRFEQYLMEAEESNASVAVFLFDVNYLKKTNDTHGHLAGDKLLCAAAECISSCFGEKCFRFGGDEFAAIVENCTPETIRHMVQHFQQKEKEQNVSISYGFAYAEELGSTDFKQMLDEADRNMYEQKRAVHKSDNGSQMKE